MILIVDTPTAIQAIKDIRTYCADRFGVMPSIVRSKALVDDIRDAQDMRSAQEGISFSAAAETIIAELSRRNDPAMAGVADLLRAYLESEAGKDGQ